VWYSRQGDAACNAKTDASKFFGTATGHAFEPLVLWLPEIKHDEKSRCVESKFRCPCPVVIATGALQKLFLWLYSLVTVCGKRTGGAVSFFADERRNMYGSQ
jgi:hypothetical protein